MKRPAIFLDRDGTLVEEVNYLHRVEDLRVFTFTQDALTILKEARFLLILVTNQSGIGRDIYTVGDMDRVNGAIQMEIGGLLDGIYFCPHLPCDGCECRKPGLGMIMDAVGDLNIDLAGSWIVGDKKIDIETGVKAGIRTALVLTGYGRDHQHQLSHSADIIAGDLAEAASLIAASTSTKIIV